MLAGPTAARGQAGWYLVPSLTLTEEYDDNLFGQPSGRKADYITRLTLGVGAGYRSAPLTVFGTYSAGAELYAHTSELNGFLNRQNAGLDLSYVPTPPLTLQLLGSYARSKTSTVSLAPTLGGGAADAPSGVTPAPSAGGTTVAGAPGTEASGAGTPPPGVPTVEVGLRESTTIGVSPSASYALSPRTSIETRYAFTRIVISAGEPPPDAPVETPPADATDTEHEALLRFTYQPTALDRGTIGYRFRLFDSSEAGSATSHVATVGWSRRLTEATTASLEVGPRFSEGGTDIEASARLEHRFRLVTLSLEYARSEILVAGRSGPQSADTGSVALTYQPLRALQLSLGGSIVRATTEPVQRGDGTAAGDAETNGRSDSGEQLTYRVGAGLVYRFTEWLSAQLSYSFALQEGAGETIRHHIVSAGLVMSYMIRVD